MHYNGVNSYLFVNGVEICKLIAKYSEINATPLCLSNFPKDFAADDMKKTGLYGYVYDFSAEFDSINVNNILDIHEYLWVKNTMK